MDNFEELRSKILNDPQARQAFNADILALLQRHGIDISEIKEKLAPVPQLNGATPMKCYGVSPQIIVCDDHHDQ